MEKNTQRVTQALYCGEDDLFYAIVNVPMTENNQSVSSVTKKYYGYKRTDNSKMHYFIVSCRGNQ